MSAFYFELRPAYAGEATYSVTVTIDGTGAIAGQTFAAAMFNPDGTAAAGSPTAVVVGDGTARQVLVTLPGQTVVGEYGWECRRTDDGSNLVVAEGTVEVTSTGGRA